MRKQIIVGVVFSILKFGAIMDRSSRENFNPAHKTFRKHSADLLTVIQDPEVLAWELYSESVISSAVVEFANNMTHERGVMHLSMLCPTSPHQSLARWG